MKQTELSEVKKMIETLFPIYVAHPIMLLIKPRRSNILDIPTPEDPFVSAVRGAEMFYRRLREWEVSRNEPGALGTDS
jgi:hypothetical protein